MLNEWSNLLAPAVQDRITLLLNHVISREPHAMARLAPFAGHAVRVRLAGWPTALPAAPDLMLGLTPAGLWERLEALPPDALLIEVDASNPAAAVLGALTGQRPRVTVQGDVALAGEMNWLMNHLRWDIEDDVAKLVGPMPAHQLARVARAVAQTFAALARSATAMRSAGRAGSGAGA